MNPLPNVSTISNTTICNGEVVNLVTNPTGGSSPYSFSWSPGTGLSNPFAQSPNANPSSTTTYSVTVTDLNLCTASTSAIITVNPIPIVSISGIQTICDGQQTNLSASGATSYTWSPTSSLNTSTGNSVTASPTITTTYTVIGSFSTGCSATTTYIVTVNPLPVVNAGPDISVCNQPIATVLTGFSPAGGVWSGPGVTASGVFTPSATGTFTLYYSFTNANGCSGIDSILVSVISSLLANAGNGFSICVNAPAFNLNTLNPTPVGGTWSGNGVVGGNFNPAGLSGQQILTYSLGAGTCLTTDTIHIFVNPLPVMNVNSPVFCIEDDATLIVNGANTYSWSPSTGLSATTGSSVIANPTVTTTYTITGTNSLTGCSNSINSVVTVNPLPVVNAGPDISVCNQPIATQLSGFSPAGGVWSGPGVTGAGVFIPSAVGTFTLIYTFTNSNSCVNKDSIIVSVIDPTLANAGTGFGICVTAPPVNLSSLNPTPVGGTWSGNGVVGSSFNPAGLNGQQILTYTVGTGTCLTTDTIRVNVHPLPVLNVNSGTICVEDDITLTAGGANTYVWSPSAGLSATTGGSVTANPTITTTYTITGTNTATGCTNTINSVVTVNPLPVVNAGSDISVCNQPIIEILTGYSPAGGTWSGNGVSSGGNFTPNGTGNYTLTYTFVNANLCVNQDSIVVSVINPSVTNAGTGFSICNQAATVTLNTLNPTPAGGSWTGSGVNANIFDPTTIAPGQYILTYTVGAGTCQTSDTIRVTVNPNPNPVVPNTAYCFGETGTITINGTDNYVWSPATDLNTTSGNSVITSTQSNTTYTVTATNSFNCSTNVSANVVVHPLPIITFDQNPVSLCYNSSTIITASGASQYQWIPDIGLNQSTGASVTISTTVTTTYTVTGTTGFGCIDSVFLPVSVNDPTDANPTNDAICFGGNTTLTVTNASTYFWSPAAGLSSQTADVVTANPQVSTTYTVVGTTSSGCTSSDIVPITVNPLPVVSIAPSSITQCAESPATLNADGALNYLWSPNISLSASTGNSVIVNPNTNTTYSVLGTDNNGCTGSATTTITVYPLPAIDAGSNITVCHTGITVTLGGFTPQGGTWNGPGIINGTGALFDPLNAGLGVHTVYYNIINANGCTNIDSITITVTPVTYPVAGPGDTLCFLDPVINLTGNAPAGGTWLGFGITNAVTGQFNPTLTGPGLHPVIYTIGQGQCTTGDTTIVLVRPLPLLSFSPNPADICVGDDIVLTISGANDYVWTPSATLNTSTGASVIANPTVNTTYTVIGIDVEGCSSTTQVPLIVHPLPLVDAGANQTVCSFDPPTYIFNFSPFGGLWTGTGITDGFTGEFSPQVSGPGTFTITYTATDIYNCTNQDDMVITVLNPVAANAGTDQSVCVNEPAFNLTGFSPAGGSWQGIGITNPTLGTFNPALAGVGVHKLIYSPPSSQCIYKDSILITVLPEPTITIIASDLTLCSGQSSNITASGGNTYTWSPSGSLNTSTGATVIASPTLTTTYTVTTVDANTCTSSNTIIITMNPVPNVTITPAALAICTGQSMNLTAGGANTYTWSPSNGLNQTTGTTVTTSATINTTYTVTGTDINGCVSTQDISVVVLQLPNLTLTEQDQWICNGSSTQLFASGAQSYTWSPFSSLNASQGSAVIASPNVTTTYTVTGTDANGCQDSDTISVTVHPPPITFNVQPQICQWETVNLIANGANEYTWTPSFGLNTSTGASVLATPTLTTTYTVVGTDIYGCTGSNAVIVTVHFPTITINPDSAEICNGQSQVFSASGAVQYAWYPSNGLNVTTSAIVSASPSITTTYTLIGTDIYGCPDTVLVPLIVHPQPEALFTYTPPEGCDSLLVTFTNLSTDADIFLWTFSDGTNSTELNPAHWFSGPGNYDVTLYVEGAGGCNDTETITDAITVWPMPVAEFAWRQSNYPVINGEVFFDNNSLNADTYNWNFGDSTYSTAVNPSHQYQQYGTYFVTLIATNDFDCKDTIVKPISVKFYKGLYLPNAMTPEYGDPATRVFTPKGFNLKSYRIQIYDTWGNMLWESTKLTERGEPAESWDGYYNGQLLQQDVYVWKVEATFLDDTVWEGMQYPSGEIKPTGTVTILR
ncbi:MAG: PKD domain-containing protein [Bacteroidota bacterium]